MKRILGATTALLVSVAGLALATPSSARAADVQIIGGTTSSLSYVVQLEFGDGRGTYGCTGELISSQWVLTARHCIDGTTWMNVYFSRSTTSRGLPTAVDRVEGSPSGDVALVHLSTPRYASTYAKLASSYYPRYGDTGSIYGFGLRAYGQPSTGLYTASVRVLGTSYDAYGGRAIHVQGINGAANHGDSGGPLIIGGLVVGVCSTGDQADPGGNINAGSNYANLTYSRSWITSVAGV